MAKHYGDFRTRHWRYLNTAPKEYRAKTSPELKELYRLKVSVEMDKNIRRSKEQVEELLKGSASFLINTVNKLENNTFGTASGTNWYSSEQIKSIIKDTLIWADYEFVCLFITVWSPSSKTWIPIKEFL